MWYFCSFIFKDIGYGPGLGIDTNMDMDMDMDMDTNMDMDMDTEVGHRQGQGIFPEFASSKAECLDLF